MEFIDLSEATQPRILFETPGGHYEENFSLTKPSQLSQLQMLTLGKDVLDCNQKYIGWVEDILISEQTQEARYLLIAAKWNFWSLHESQFVYPVPRILIIRPYEIVLEDSRRQIHDCADFDLATVYHFEALQPLSFRTHVENEKIYKDARPFFEM